MNITFMPGAITTTFDEGDTILRAAARAGIQIRTDCGGMGSCKKCRVVITTAGKRQTALACVCKAEDGMLVEIPHHVEETERKARLLRMPEALVIDREETGIGIAVDIGTTTVAATALRLGDGTLLGTRSMANPQRKYGADVISRIAFASEAGYHVRLLQQEVIGGITKLTEEILQKISRRPEEIRRYVAVGNTTMSHLFLGLDPSGLGEEPFAPVFMQAQSLRASELGLPGGAHTQVYVAANMAGHVGSDVTADLLATRMEKSEENRLIVDVGTNGEILLESGGKISVCSAAAGPAFEGGALSCGMGGEDGAIERIALSADGVKLTVIGDTAPCGICGSGIIDGVSQMLTHGLMDETGRILSRQEAAGSAPDKLLAHLAPDGDVHQFVLYAGEADTPQIAITQRDVRQIQLAKAAISAGIRTLLKSQNMQAEDLDHVYLAGAFGSYIAVESAITLGLLPDVDRERIIALGNGAGVGAALMCLSSVYRETAEELAARAEHMELAAHSDFQENYIRAMNFERPNKA